MMLVGLWSASDNAHCHSAELVEQVQSVSISISNGETSKTAKTARSGTRSKNVKNRVYNIPHDVLQIQEESPQPPSDFSGRSKVLDSCSEL